MRFADVLRGEAAKAWTLRSLRWTILVTVVASLAFCLVDAGPVTGLSTPETAGVYAMANFSFFAAIAGVLIASSEYGGGQLTTTALAVPRRGRTLAAKLLLSAIIATAQGLILAVFIATIQQFPLGEQSVYATGTAGALLGSLVLAVCSWTAIGILSTSIAVIIRSQTIAPASMIVLTFGGTPLMMALPIFQYLPTNAGVLMYIDRANQTSDWLNPPDITVPAAGVTLTAWCIAAVVAATGVLRRRDIGARQASTE
ncbi:ABC transporter permease subunit [Brevibacterium ammoniilyticum]|uniref:ABC transporter permease subunit n=1 Tax=Brevibacterium ammoniilyticum TaxID=1046555 RepID=A0ABP9TZG7_9MICO